MKVNGSFFVGNDMLDRRAGMQNEPDSKVSKHNSVNAKSFVSKMDPIAQKKEEAKKRAMRLISNAFESEKLIDKSVESRRDNISKLVKDKSEASKAITELESDRKSLKSTYGVEDDSQEQKDLELLEKEKRSRFAGSGVTLSGEDFEALAELKERIKKTGLSEYQEKSLELLSYEENSYNAIAEADAQIALENKVISQTLIDRQKSDPIDKAFRQGEAIKDAANRQVLGMLIDEGKSYIDEIAQEKQEEAQEKKEKKEEQEDRIEAVKANADRIEANNRAIKEKQEENEKLTENILEGEEISGAIESTVNSAQQEVKDMMSKLKLIEDDIKGAAVDKNI